ncbi:MAG: hypothetical protein K0R71_2355 [Bacillales bacterium]|jgi:hypothetical protein|nr:hypothetical protein [Bacillales bacterium]
MKKYSIAVLLFILLIFSLKVIFLGNTRDFISVKHIDWGYLVDTKIYSWIELIEVETGATVISITKPNQFDFATLMIKNEDAISSTEKESYVKIRVQFEKIPWFSSQHSPGKYNGKECDFYISLDLANKVKELPSYGAYQ